MNKLFTLVFLLIAGTVGAQSLSEPVRLFPRRNFAPPIDTIFEPIRLGELRSRPNEGKIYMAVSFVGQRWIPISGDGGGGGGPVSFSSILGQPLDNANLATVLNNKQSTLVSGINLKSVNNQTLLGPGDLTVSVAWGGLTGLMSAQTDLQNVLDAKQPLDADLSTIAGLTPVNNDILQRKAGAWTFRTPAQFKADLALLPIDVGLENVPNVNATLRSNHTGTQPWSTITGTPTTRAGYGITDAAASTHAHPIGDVTGLQTELNKSIVLQNASTTGSDLLRPVDDSTSKLRRFRFVGPDTSASNSDYVNVDMTLKTVNLQSLWGPGNINISSSVAWGNILGSLPDQTDLQTALNGKANTAHTHAQADVTNLTTDLAAKQPLLSTNSSPLDLNAVTVANASAAVNAQTGTSYSLQASDNGKIITLSNAAAITLTVPATLPTGFNCTIVQLGAGQVTVTASGVTIQNRQAHTKLAGQYAMATLVEYTANVLVFQGDTTN